MELHRGWLSEQCSRGKKLELFQGEKNLGKLVKQNMGQARVINEMGNMSLDVTRLVLEESGEWKEPWLVFADGIYSFHIHSVLYT